MARHLPIVALFIIVIGCGDRADDNGTTNNDTTSNGTTNNDTTNNDASDDTDNDTDNDTNMEDGGSGAAQLDDLCAAVIEWAQACPTDPPGVNPDTCLSDLACPASVARDGVVELATACLARNDCETNLQRCFRADEAGYTPSPEYDAFRTLCFERRMECFETFDGQPCFAEWVRDDILAAMMACLDLPCDQLSDCVYIESGFTCM